MEAASGFLFVIFAYDLLSVILVSGGFIYRWAVADRVLNSLGVHPTIRLNIRLMCCGYWKPRLYAISLIDLEEESSSSFALSISFP